MGKRRAWSEVRDKRLAKPAARAGYERARRAFELAEQVRTLREAQGMSQSELARRIGSTQPAIARLEAGGVAPTIETLSRIAAALGVELSVSFKATKKAG
jgi:ribosome-binding protein aMBF1 (putative translation factor)